MHQPIISGDGGNVGGCWKSKQTWQWRLSRTSSLCDFKIMMMMLMINDHDHEIIIRMWFVQIVNMLPRIIISSGQPHRNRKENADNVDNLDHVVNTDTADEFYLTMHHKVHPTAIEKRILTILTILTMLLMLILLITKNSSPQCIASSGRPDRNREENERRVWQPQQKK